MNEVNVAFETALAFYRKPESLFEFRQASIPVRMDDLIRLASAESVQAVTLAKKYEIDESQVARIAENYIKSICMHKQATPFRMLCINDTAPLTQAKEQYRLLMKWLHPDKNPLNSEFAERVNRAWNAIKSNGEIEVDVAITAPMSNAEPRKINSRFPLFITGIIALCGVLLTLSLLPESEVYVSTTPNDKAELEPNVENATQMEMSLIQRLQAIAMPDEARKVEKQKTQAHTDVAVTVNKTKLPQRTDSTPKKTVIPEIQPELVEDRISVPMPVLSAESKLITTQKPTAVNAGTVSTAQTISANHALDVTSEQKTNVETKAPALSRAECSTLVQAFISAYRNGNHSAFMRVFAQMATSNRGDRIALSNDYQQMFIRSSTREIKLSRAQWSMQPNSATLVARYVTHVEFHDARVITKSGKIQLSFVKENNQTVISQLLILE